jgi:phage pi2 protein 07
MKTRTLAVACLVLLVLIGLLYWSEHRKPKAEASADTSPAILKLDEASITGLELKKPDTPPLLLAKDSSGTWQITQPKPFSADQNVVSGMLATLSSLNSESLVQEKSSDLKPYGLEPPALEVDVTGKDKREQKLLIGDMAPTGGAVYAAVAGDPRVFTMAAFNKNSLDKSLDDLRDKRLLKVDAAKISRIDIAKPAQDLEFGRNASSTANVGESAGLAAEWQILKPKPLRADSLKVDELARQLAGAEMDLGGTGAKDAAAGFARAKPFLTAKVTDPSGTEELQLRKDKAKDKDDYYAKSSVIEGAYRVKPDLAQALDRNLDDFRNKKLFDFGFTDPNNLELHSGGKAYFLVRNGEDWWSNGKKMDAFTVESFLEKLRGLSATGFADSGFTAPAVEAMVVSNDGKRVEKVSFAKAGDRYLAKRDKADELYEVSAGAVDELQKAADEMKPAAKPHK